ncbi:DUF6529 family protein [Streptomyces sp. NPDC002952]|uniref:DUF6529 family protein n=1 Tax=Streptomyces sp. NPDC002952 TaxID=3364673 RepID=UPI003673C782
MLLGALVAVAVGVYGSSHEATGRPLALVIGFSGMAPMKAWLATVSAFFAIIQVISALWMWERVRSWGPPPAAVAPLHRWSGTIAFLFTLPVAYHCLWSIGFATFDTRTTVHSLLGCVFYGAFATKMLALRSHGLPKWTLPVFGGLLFATLIGLWLSASVWYFSQPNVPLF